MNNIKIELIFEPIDNGTKHCYTNYYVKVNDIIVYSTRDHESASTVYGKLLIEKEKNK